MDGFICVLIIDATLLICFLFSVARRALARWSKVLRAFHGKEGEGGDTETGSRGISVTGNANSRTTSQANEIQESPDVANELSDGIERSEESFRSFIDSVGKCVGSGEAGVSLAWENISLHISSGMGHRKQGKIILEKQSGVVERGNMWAIMGGSGAGKSTIV